jgi:hypothetical protein
LVKIMTDWKKKLESEEPLSSAEEAELDRALESADQRLIAAKMRALGPLVAPPGLASEFEGRVVRAGRLRLATAFAAGAAACLALVVVLYEPAQKAIPTTGAIGESLYDWHYEAVATSVLPGDGANLAGFSQVAGGETGRR